MVAMVILEKQESMHPAANVRLFRSWHWVVATPVTLLMSAVEMVETLYVPSIALFFQLEKEKPAQEMTLAPVVLVAATEMSDWFLAVHAASIIAMALVTLEPTVVMETMATEVTERFPLVVLAA